MVSVLEGLHSEMIAGQKQVRTARAEIANGEGEHAFEFLNAIRTFLFVEVDHNFGVGVGGKAVAFTLQLAAKVGKVVDLAVVRDPDRAVLVAHGHVAAGGEVENGKAAAAEANVGTIRKSSLPQTGIVRAAVGLHARHAREHFSVSAIGESGNSTHDRASCYPLFSGFFNLSS